MLLDDFIKKHALINKNNLAKTTKLVDLFKTQEAQNNSLFVMNNNINYNNIFSTNMLDANNMDALRNFSSNPNYLNKNDFFNQQDFSKELGNQFFRFPNPNNDFGSLSLGQNFIEPNNLNNINPPFGNFNNLGNQIPFQLQNLAFNQPHSSLLQHNLGGNNTHGNNQNFGDQKPKPRKPISIFKSIPPKVLKTNDNLNLSLLNKKMPRRFVKNGKVVYVQADKKKNLSTNQQPAEPVSYKGINF
jgi:hypothetical protein